MHVTDEQLVDAARGGDENAFSELFTRHHGRLLMLALQYRLTAQDAEDAVQQTMMKAWQGLGGFRGESRFATWITRVLMNEVFQSQRKRARMRLEEMESASLTAVLEAVPDWQCMVPPADIAGAAAADDGAEPAGACGAAVAAGVAALGAAAAVLRRALARGDCRADGTAGRDREVAAPPRAAGAA